MRKIKVLIVDDSALTRAVLERIINADEEIEVVASAIDPIIAAKKIQKFQPDVITLDILMPRMNGLVFLKKLMHSSPLPVVVISGNSPKASTTAIRALELGALEVIEKPDISTPDKLNEVSENICQAIKAGYIANDKQKLQRLPKKGILNDNFYKKESFTPFTGHLKKEQTQTSEPKDLDLSHTGFYVMGSSTGGPQALKSIFKGLSINCKGIIVAQHMPAMFTKSFASRLNDECTIKVVEATNGERIEEGKAIIIPGDYHGLVQRDINGFYVRLEQTEKVNRHRPSVDVLFNSAAYIAGKRATGILLTGMGEDGAKGLLELSQQGSVTMAQDERSSVVFGMPKKAIELGAAKAVVTPSEIIDIINESIKTTL